MECRYKLGSKSYEKAETWAAFVLLLPTFIALIFLFFIPTLRLFLLSFTDTNTITNVSKFTGLANFKYLFKSQVFLKSMRNTFAFTAAKLTSEITISLVLAVMLDARIPFRKFLRITYFAPVVVPVVASSTIWLWLYAPTFSPLNQILQAIGLTPLKWIYSADTALFSIILFSVWRGIGYDVVVFLSGLQEIPDSTIEAARVDGGNGWDVFWRIKLPLLKPIIAFVLMMGLIGSFQAFTEVDIMTPNGGPKNSTLLMVNYIYQQAFGNTKMGRGAAASLVLFAIIFVFTYLQRVLQDRMGE